MNLIGKFTIDTNYNFALLLDVLRRFAYPTVDRVRDNAYWRVIQDETVLALVRVTQHNQSTLHVHLVETRGEVNTAQILTTLRHILGIDMHLTPFYDFARTRPELWQVIAPILGVRWLRTATPFEALCTTIIEQQIAWTTAQRAQRWLVEWADNAVHYDNDTFYAFATPAQLASATVEALTPLKITFRRMRLLIHVATLAENGDINFDALRDVTPAQAYTTLTAIKGIGHWTAAWTLARAQGTFAYVGHNDVALQAAVNHYFYGGMGKIPEEKVIETFAPYGDFAGLAAHHTILRWVLDRYD